MISHLDGDIIINGLSIIDIVERYGAPIYIYDEDTILKKIYEVSNSLDRLKHKIFYSVKANSNPHILEIFRRERLGVDVVSIGELSTCLKVGFPRRNIMYTGNNVTLEELMYVVESKTLLNVDSTNQLRLLLERGGLEEVGLRVNPGFGVGHHKYAITGGAISKFGIPLSKLWEAVEICRANGVKIARIHSHVGSGISDHNIHLRILDIQLKIAEKLRDVEMLDVGGGYAVPYRRRGRRYNFKKLALAAEEKIREFEKKTGRSLTLALEPGRYLVAQSGILVAEVTDVREVGGKVIIGTNTGMNHLIRPTLYNAYHEIVVLSRNKLGERVKADIVGNICESGDVLGRDRLLPKPRIGDYIAILDVGAYGYSMASTYNSRPLPAEVLVDENGKPRLIRKRQTLEDLLRNVT